MPRKCHRFRNLLVAGVVLVSGHSSQAFIYDFESDFSKVANTESSRWSYRWKDGFTRDGIYLLLPTFRTDLWMSMPYFPVWTLSDSQTYPFIGVNDSGSAIHDPGNDPDANWPWPNGQSNLHPSGSPSGFNALAVVSWLSPLTGSVDIQLRITDLDGRTDGGGDGVSYFVDRGNASGNLASGSIPNGGDTGFFWIYDVPVSAGDRLNFIIAPDANYNNDSTRMFIQIVPEPTALSVTALGVAWWLARRRNSLGVQDGRQPGSRRHSQ